MTFRHQKRDVLSQAIHKSKLEKPERLDTLNEVPHSDDANPQKYSKRGRTDEGGDKKHLMLESDA